jgi:hypothetical protein
LTGKSWPHTFKHFLHGRLVSIQWKLRAAFKMFAGRLGQVTIGLPLPNGMNNARSDIWKNGRSDKDRKRES